MKPHKPEGLPRCVHGVYDPDAGSKKPRPNAACSLCTPATVRDKPGTLTVAANAEPLYRRQYAYDPWYDLPAVADKASATDNPATLRPGR